MAVLELDGGGGVGLADGVALVVDSPKIDLGIGEGDGLFCVRGLGDNCKEDVDGVGLGDGDLRGAGEGDGEGEGEGDGDGVGVGDGEGAVILIVMATAPALAS